MFESDIVQQAAESCAYDKTKFLPGVPLWQNQASQSSHHPHAIHADDAWDEMHDDEIVLAASVLLRSKL